jgi:hypothetical protein
MNISKADLLAGIYVLKVNVDGVEKVWKLKK